MPVINTKPTLEILTPVQNSTVSLNTPFAVTGTAAGVSGTEPILVDFVTVQVDQGTPVRAQLSPDLTNRNRGALIFDYSASVEVTGGADPHIVTVAATSDRGESTIQSRNVFVDVPFQADTPAIIIDLLSLAAEMNGQQLGLTPASLTSLASGMSKALVPLSNSLAPYRLMIAGPNLIAGPPMVGFSSVRIGIWVEDFSFVVVPPLKPDFPLPRLPDKGAIASFAPIAFLPAPLPDQISPTFAVAAPLGAMQKVANAILPSLQAASSSAEINTIVVHSSPDDIEVDVNGTANSLPISFTLAVKETLGTQQVGSANPADPSRTIPAVIHSSHESSIDDPLLAALFGLVTLPFGTILVTIADFDLGDAAANGGKQATATLKQALAAVPSLIPISAGDLPSFLPGLPDFPRIVLDWQSFGSAATEILGTGTTTIDGRDASMVAVEVQPSVGEISGVPVEISRVTPVSCKYSLSNILPDDDGLTWTALGPGTTNSGPINPSSSSFTANLLIPYPPAPGATYRFTVTVYAVETKPNSTLTLTGSGSAEITVQVDKARKGPPE